MCPEFAGVGSEVVQGRWGKSATGSSRTRSLTVDDVAVFECCTTSCLTRWWLRRPGTRLASTTLMRSKSPGADGSLYFKKVSKPRVSLNRLQLDPVTPGSMEAEVTQLVDTEA